MVVPFEFAGFTMLPVASRFSLFVPGFDFALIALPGVRWWVNSSATTYSLVRYSIANLLHLLYLFYKIYRHEPYEKSIRFIGLLKYKRPETPGLS